MFRIVTSSFLQIIIFMVSLRHRFQRKGSDSNKSMAKDTSEEINIRVGSCNDARDFSLWEGCKTLDKKALQS